MKKVIKCLNIVLMLVIIVLSISPVFSTTLDYENGHFEKIQSNLEIYGCPLKLKDGRVLILDVKKNYIFNPKDNTFRETTPLPYGFSNFSNGKTFPAVVLNNGKVFIIGAVLAHPYDKFRNELSDEIQNKLLFCKIQSDPNYIGLTLSKKKYIIGQLYRDFQMLPYKKKEEIYLPIIMRNPDLLKRYNEYCQIREKSRRALLFDPNSETYEVLDGFISDNDTPCDFIPIIKSDNEILIFTLFNNRNIQLYNLSDNTTTKINSPKDYKINNIFPIGNNKILILLDLEHRKQGYCFYDMETNTFSEIQSFPILGNKLAEVAKLDDKNLLLFGDTEDQGIYIFNIIDKSYKHITNYSFERYVFYEGPMRPLVTDNKIFIFGGLKNKYVPGIFSTTHQISGKAEIINLRTNVSKLKLMNYFHKNPKSIILDDGRILIYEGIRSELYIPRGYKK